MNEQLYRKVKLTFSLFDLVNLFIRYLASNDVEETNTLGFFELLEQEKAQAEMKKMLAKKKLHPIAPDGR